MYHDCSPTAALSNTVCISDPNGQWQSVKKKTIQDFLEFGEVARIDTSILQCALVTYFDVRDAQKVLLEWVGVAEPFLPAAHDFRTVQINMVEFTRKHPASNFAQFGEVAHVGMLGCDLLVEFYDLRASQALLVEAADCASPWMPQSQMSMSMLPEPVAPPVPLTSLAKAALKAEEEAYAGTNFNEAEKASGPVRTKITNKEFTKYDIDPAKLLSGEDQRTTVMVRNLVGSNARKNFMAYLEKCGLHDKHTFFYMPCKEHRNVPVGFAFVNFSSPNDVHCLYTMMKSERWSELICDPNSSKKPALSFARFQGHEELMAHFSTSAVLSRRNPEKRPSFRPVNEVKAQSPKSPTSPVQNQEGNQACELQVALAKGVEKINELLMKQKAPPGMGSSTPAYVFTPSLQGVTKQDAKRGGRPQSAQLHGIVENDDGECQISMEAQGA